jgi:hypothetical protein
MSEIATKKAKILAYIKKHLKRIDPNSVNTKRYEDWLGNMSDVEFDKFMKNMKDKKFQFHLIVPNLEPKFNMDDLQAAADSVGAELFHRVWLTDNLSGVRFLTRYKYPIMQLPVRRMQQFLDKKLSVPDNDRTLDGLTGQVTGDDASASITAPEIQALHARDLRVTLDELVTVRGGDIANYGEARRQMEEQGSFSMKTLDARSVSRTAKIAEVLLTAMHISSNLTEGE